MDAPIEQCQSKRMILLEYLRNSLTTADEDGNVLLVEEDNVNKTHTLLL